MRLAIDFENPAPGWWDAGGRDLWEALLEGFDGSSVVVDRALADSWLAQAAAVPGWADGPEWAPHPICLKPIDEDEAL